MRTVQVDGSCLADEEGPPAGLQLYLSSASRGHVGDTLVMENLGYFQLQATPGVWALQLSEAHAQVYGIEGADKAVGGGKGSEQDVLEVAVSSYNQPGINLRVQRR